MQKKCPFHRRYGKCVIMNEKNAAANWVRVEAIVMNKEKMQSGEKCQGGVTSHDLLGWWGVSRVGTVEIE